MKFFENWIREYYKSNLNIKNIIFILKKNSFEIKNKNINIINHKYYLKKVIFYKNVNKNLSFIKTKDNIILNIKNKKENLIKKNIFIKKNDIKKNKIFNIYKTKIKNIYIWILYVKKKQIKKQLDIIKKYNYLDINIPYNRYDCNNIYGLSRELSILSKKKIINKKYQIKNKIKNNYSIKIEFWNKKIIQNYKYLLIKKINLYKFITPKFILERLKKLEINIKNNILDLLIYILIESGQKIISLDLNKIKKYNKYKYINKNKKKNLYINNFFLSKKNTKKFSTTKKTKNIVLIAPLFSFKYIEKIKNKYLNNQNKYLNNYDKYTQFYFLNKTSYLLKKICGGKISNIITKEKYKYKKKFIKLPYKYIKNKIGINIKKEYIIKMIKQIKCKILKKKKYLYILTPPWRNDLKIKEDLIEEITKKFGYNNIPNKSFISELIFNKENYNIKKINKIKFFFSNIGYKEVINFHFFNKKKKHFFLNKQKYIKIYNPISKNMELMRTSLIPGLIKNIYFNSKRQHKNIKFFEIGTCYTKKKEKIIQEIIFSAAIYGYRNKENWFIKNNNIFDFYDIKGDLEYFLKKNKKYRFIKIKPSKNKILDNYQNIKILFKKKKIGFMGMLNHKIQKYYSFKYPIYLFEIKLKNILISEKKKIKNISKYPNNIRDITLILSNYIWITDIIKKCYLINKNRIKKIIVIKNYINKNLKKKKLKNITLRIIIQDKKKTLNDKEINKIINKCKKTLKKNFSALIND